MRDNAIFKFFVLFLIPIGGMILCEMLLPPYYVLILNLLMINIIFTASLNLTNGFTGIFSLGHAGFIAIGAYVSSLLTLTEDVKRARIVDVPDWLACLHLPFPIAILLAGFIAMAIAAVIGGPVLKVKGDYLSVITLGLIVIIKGILDNNASLTNGAKGLGGMEGYSNFRVVLIVTLVSLYLMYKLICSSYGRNMKAIREDEQAAASIGIPVTKYKVMAFSVGAFGAAVGGALWAHLQRSITPGFFYFDETYSIVQMSVLGGMFSLSGAIPGAMIITFLPQILAGLESGITIGSFSTPPMYGLSKIIMSILFILIIIFRREGIMGRSEYILSGLFDKNTYSAVWKKDTWREFLDIVKTMFINKRRMKIKGGRL